MSIPNPFRPVCGKPGGSLPQGWTELEYLESTGTQYIDTGYKPHNVLTKVEASVQIVSATGEGWGSLMGCRSYEATAPVDEFYYSSMIITANYGSKWLRLDNLFNSDLSYTSVNMSYGKVIDISYENNSITIDGVNLSGTGTKVPTRIQYNFLLFNAYYADAIKWKSANMRCWGLKLYELGKIVRNFVPALDPAGRPCMFDLVTQRPFYNQGTGEFRCGYKLPSGYTQVTAIRFNNGLSDKYYNCYVDTGIVFGAKGVMRVEAATSVRSDKWQYNGYYNQSGDAIQWGVSPSSVLVSAGLSILTGLTNDGKEHVYTINLNTEELMIDSTRLAITSSVELSPTNMYIGNRNSSAESYLLNTPADITLYSLFYKDASVKSVLVPCKDSSNNACLYDVCRDIPLYSSGSIKLTVVN